MPPRGCGSRAVHAGRGIDRRVDARENATSSSRLSGSSAICPPDGERLEHPARFGRRRAAHRRPAAARARRNRRRASRRRRVPRPAAGQALDALRPPGGIDSDRWPRERTRPARITSRSSAAAACRRDARARAGSADRPARRRCTPLASHSLANMLIVVKPGMVLISLTYNAPVVRDNRKSTRDMPAASTDGTPRSPDRARRPPGRRADRRGSRSATPSSRYLAS